jgi:hypothetical protein
VTAVRGRDRIQRVREIIARAAALLERPRLDSAPEMVKELECALAELEKLKVDDIGVEGRQLAAALRADLDLVSALHGSASRFYRGWARIAAGNVTAYTPSGAEAPPDPGASVSIRG